MKKYFVIIFLILFGYFTSAAQEHHLIGYWHNWQAPDAPYIPLNEIDNRYSIIEVAFALPTNDSDMTMTFIPDVVSESEFIAQVNALQEEGKKVLISIGGGTGTIDLSTIENKNAFISSMLEIISTYGFDGIDLDIEHGQSIVITEGSISAPSNPAMIHLIEAVKTIMAQYRSIYHKKMMLTMAPETAFVQGGQSAFGGLWGAYLPIIEALRDSIDILQVQLYNSGTMYGIDGEIYTQGTPDFIVAMCEAVIQGFSTSGGDFEGLPAHKIAIGLPACHFAAGGGYIDTMNLYLAAKYLLGSDPQPGTYILSNASGYPDLAGIMTWSINWDAVSSCGNVYDMATTYQRIFGMPSHISHSDLQVFCSIYPNPSTGTCFIEKTSPHPVTINIYNSLGTLVFSKVCSNKKTKIELEHLPKGMYWIKAFNSKQQYSNLKIMLQ